jgi:hypothetical protein
MEPLGRDTIAMPEGYVNAIVATMRLFAGDMTKTVSAPNFAPSGSETVRTASELAVVSDSTPRFG